MILAEKITKLRKQNGWSQEELAIKLGVSRQSVSKWESTASIPDLERIIKLAEIFEVSTDYLLKDSLEEDITGVTVVESKSYENEDAHIISLEEANAYMHLIQRISKRFALAVAACVVSPVILVLLSGMSEYGALAMTEEMAAGIGGIILLIIVIGAVTVFILDGIKLSKYEYLENDALFLQYGVAGIVESKQENFEPVFAKCIASGVALCIASVIPLLTLAALEKGDLSYVYGLCILLVLVAIGVYLFVWSGMMHSCYQKLLEQGDYEREKKWQNQKNAYLNRIYWGSVTAIYLGISFLTNRWGTTWIVWPCSGVLYVAVCGVAAIVRKR